jgi:hypothetical protein
LFNLLLATAAHHSHTNFTASLVAWPALWPFTVAAFLFVTAVILSEDSIYSFLLFLKSFSVRAGRKEQRSKEYRTESTKLLCCFLNCKVLTAAADRVFCPKRGGGPKFLPLGTLGTELAALAV